MTIEIPEKYILISTSNNLFIRYVCHFILKFFLYHQSNVQSVSSVHRSLPILGNHQSATGERWTHCAYRYTILDIQSRQHKLLHVNMRQSSSISRIQECCFYSKAKNKSKHTASFRRLLLIALICSFYQNQTTIQKLSFISDQT